MYLYFYPPDSLTHRKLLVTYRNKMVNGKVRIWPKMPQGPAL